MKLSRILLAFISATLFSAGSVLAEEVNKEMIPTPHEEIEVPSTEVDVPAWNYEVIEG